jgi:hypothetical protein
MIETVIGSIGFLLLLAAFLLNLVGRMSRQGFVYLALNMAGAGALAWYALSKDAPVFVALEGIWSLTAAITLAHMAWTRSQKRGPTPIPPG